MLKYANTANRRSSSNTGRTAITYCVVMCLADGLVLAFGSRTNAGVDHIATFKKLYAFHQEGERVLVLQPAGNLATTQSTISLLSARICTQQEPNLMQVASLYDVAMLIGKTLPETIQRDSSNQQNCSNVNFNCNLLFGGQIAGETHRLFHIYPEGNFIEATRDTSYFQIDEGKYGRPIIDRVLTIDIPLEQVMCCASISIDSTLCSNLSVGLPLDMLLYRSGSLSSAGQHRITDNDPYLNHIRKAWSEGLSHTSQTPPTWTPVEREEGQPWSTSSPGARPHG